MTREEAIKNIKEHCYFANLIPRAKEALDMAIKALGQTDIPPVVHSGWILANKKLPDDREWYLGVFKETDTGWVNSLPFVCECVGHKTDYTTNDGWILRGITDIDNPSHYYRNLECVAWMPLPQQYRKEQTADRDCPNCIHHINGSCEKWECEFERKEQK